VLVSWSVDLHGAYELCHYVLRSLPLVLLHFVFMARDLYTGCQPVFVPSNSVYCAASYVSIVGDGGEDAIGLKTHSCKESSNSGLMSLLWCRRVSVQKIHSCGSGGEDAFGLITPVVLPVATGLLVHVFSAHNHSALWTSSLYGQRAQFCAPGIVVSWSYLTAGPWYSDFSDSRVDTPVVLVVTGLCSCSMSQRAQFSALRTVASHRRIARHNAL
jgi:hypothetical protein